MSGNVYIYILVMSLVTYLIRMLPLTLIRKTIRSPFLRSFLHYVPYVTLSVMTFPAILSATSSHWSGLAGFITAVLLSYKGKGLIFVSLASCLVVFLLELILV
ncbi:MAG: AzlD domain-containing protein [Clostridia bacterium]|nr:AzlD domain-containing protein [Clostridia bacterium]MDD6681875.1 AzlD domain-containing protein [Clostridiales bacterium]